MARVGSEGIFAKEIMGATIAWKNGKKSEVICAVMGGVDEILEPYKDKMSSSQFETQRTMLIKQRLINCIETKIIYLDAKQNFPAEHFSDVEKQLDKFYESTALPGLYKCCDVKSTRELDQKLRARGLSLEAREEELQGMGPGPGMREPANKTRRGNYVRSDVQLLSGTSGRLRNACPGKMGRTDGPVLEISQQA